MDERDETTTNEPANEEQNGGRGGLKFCMFGVLVAFAALLITIGIVFMGIRSLSSQEGGWGRLDETLDFDERPEGWEVKFGIPHSIFTGFTLVSLYDEPDELRVLFYLDVDPDVVDKRFDDAANESQRQVLGSGTLMVQGRELRYIDYEASDKEGDYLGRTVDISAPDATFGTLVEFLRETNRTRVTDADVARELAPFHIGPDR